MNSVYTSIAQISSSLGLQETGMMEGLKLHDDLESKDDLFHLIQKIGVEGGKIEEAADLVANLEERIDLIEHKLKFIDESRKPTVLVLTAVTPPVFENSDYAADILKTVASKVYDSQVKEGDKHFDPEIILIISEGFEKEIGGIAELLLLEEWRETAAAQNNRIYLIDGQKGFKGYSTYIADDIETLAEIIYPQYLTFGGNGDKWIQFEI